MDHANQAAVGIIGLGIMGSALADQLISKRFSVFGFDPDPKARKRASRSGVQVVSSVELLLSHSQQLLSSLPSSDAFEASCEALIEHLTHSTPKPANQAPIVLAETSTLPISIKQRQQRRLATAGITLLDCPLSGTGAQARVGDVVVYASGPKKAIRNMMPVFAGFSRAQVDLGRFGNGMRMKLVANLLVAIHNVAAAEAILLGKRLGLNPAEVVRVVGDGAGSSRMLQVRGPMMASRNWKDATMKVSIWQKDMSIISDALADTLTPAPLFAASAPIYQAAQALGLGEQDTASVMAVLEHMVGASA
ncbi:MAG: NAD(P)-dependent oxidoreductase [Burkholderiaceae bacterium]|jgi:3-hydroxyisobutyrate dehydrogenase-like beta-hydroxyacid dehydrogenase|nr:NAD(P)-dependent oxidoreductase [Betaproteobacteria bacterium]